MLICTANSLTRKKQRPIGMETGFVDVFFCARNVYNVYMYYFHINIPSLLQMKAEVHYVVSKN